MDTLIKIFNIPKAGMVLIGMDEDMAQLVQWFLYIVCIGIFGYYVTDIIDMLIVK